MKITLLGSGTSQGVPVIGCECEVCCSLDYRDKRTRTSALLQASSGTTLVIDTGPDFRVQFLTAHVKRLDAVLLTHSHKDHTAGLDDVRAFNHLQNCSIPLFGQPHTIQRIAHEYDYVFAKDKYPGTPELSLNSVTLENFFVDDMEIIPLPVVHMKLNVLGFRVGNFSYITDANFIPETTMEKLKGTEVLVLNALHKKKHISHFNLDEAVAVTQKVGARQTYFTHIGHLMGLHSKVNEELPDGIELAWDGLEIEISE